MISNRNLNKMSKFIQNLCFHFKIIEIVWKFMIFIIFLIKSLLFYQKLSKNAKKPKSTKHGLPSLPKQQISTPCNSKVDQFGSYLPPPRALTWAPFASPSGPSCLPLGPLLRPFGDPIAPKLPPPRAPPQALRPFLRSALSEHRYNIRHCLGSMCNKNVHIYMYTKSCNIRQTP